MTICENNMNLASVVPFNLTCDDVTRLYDTLTCSHCLVLMVRKCGMEQETRELALEIANRVVLALPSIVGDDLVKPNELTPITDYASARRAKKLLWEASSAANKPVRNPVKWETLFDATEMVGCVSSEWWPSVAWYAAKVDPTENTTISDAIRQRWSVETLLTSLQQFTQQ